MAKETFSHPKEDSDHHRMHHREKGRVKNIKVMRGFAPEYDKEAIRVVKKLPKWKPGKMNGKAYKSKYCIPVVFEKEI